MFRVKICGVANLEDAWCCAEAGADAIGLNFYPPSPRCVGVEVARRIALEMPATMTKVGVFVNASRDEMLRTYDRAGLDAIQLHGDETPQMMAELAGRQLVKAFRCGSDDVRPLAEFLRRCEDLGCRPCGVLIDAYQPSVFGGTGQIANWSVVRNLSELLLDIPIVLAGGLRPENVAAAIEATHPAAVDTASGVESEPGRKDPQRVRAFIGNAWDAFRRLDLGGPLSGRP
ncbi:MAG: phosphoribosylanthranilate isomerase [Pirellulaceae bacterium]|jgi:phosphoribosylanthranilate isomerase|nr:phosphoribosylanthranilate isomerase [Pirellulaceae bacterium]